MKKKSLLPLVAILLLQGAAVRADPGDPPSAAIFDEEEDCSALPPAAYSASGITDDGHEVSVEVAVLLDGVKKPRAEKVMAKAASAYAELEVDLVAKFHRRIRIIPDAAATAGDRATIDGAQAISQAKALIGGTRPDRVDVVHILTNKDITLPNSGSAPVGIAECAGGVQYADKAFSVSEDGTDAYSVDVTGLVNVLDVPAKAVAHEIGHLLGGLHEQKSCVEGAAPEDVTNREPSPCTIMSDVVDLASLRFGVMESTVIRGYALRFADS